MKAHKFMVPRVLAFDGLRTERIDIKITIVGVLLELAHEGCSGPTCCNPLRTLAFLTIFK